MRITHKPRLSALAIALLVAAAALLLPSSASAHNSWFTIAGTLHLSDGFGADGHAPGCFGGVAGGFHGTNTATALPPGTRGAYAGFTYNNPEFLIGDAEGNLEIHMDDGRTVEESFQWERIGSKAIIVFTGAKAGHTGIGVATFVPIESALFRNFNCQARTDKNYSHGSWTNDEHVQFVAEVVMQTA